MDVAIEQGTTVVGALAGDPGHSVESTLPSSLLVPDVDLHNSPCVRSVGIAMLHHTQVVPQERNLPGFVEPLALQTVAYFNPARVRL